MLGLLMRRRGWSAPCLAQIAGGISASSIRAYLADRTAPRPSHAVALARALGPQDGRTLLEAWGHTDLAEGFMDEGHKGSTREGAERISELPARYSRHNRLEYAGDPLPEPALKVVHSFIEWMQHIQSSAGLHLRVGPDATPALPQSADSP